LKVALIHDWLNGMRGGEKVLEALCEIFPKAVIFTLFYQPEKVSATIRRHEIRTSFLDRIPGTRKLYRHFLPLFPRAIERFDLSGFDLVISSSHCVAKGARTGADTLHICYCHSPMRYVWDRFDDYFQKETLGSIRYRFISSQARKLREWDVASSSRVDLFIANSAFVQDRISRYYRRPSKVIHPYADTDYFKPDLNPDIMNKVEPQKQEPYYLAVSALVPYKRISDIVMAFKNRRERVVIVGDGPEKEKLVEMASRNVEFTGWLSGDHLLSLYRNCEALIFPGVEDFGIVPVEAQACSKPVLALAEGGALETVIGPILGTDKINGNGASGLFYKTAGPDSIVEAIKAFSEIKFDKEFIRNNALKFSKSVFKRTMLDFVKESYSRFRTNGKRDLEAHMIPQAISKSQTKS
jgi:glycosyltransferase involved in cell wall biosynthesis